MRSASSHPESSGIVGRAPRSSARSRSWGSRCSPRGSQASNTAVAVASLTVLGFAFGGVPALLQARMLRAASPRLRELASAGFTTSFNLAIAAGALVGGIVLDRIGVGALPFLSAALALVGVALILVGDVWLRRRAGYTGASRNWR